MSSASFARLFLALTVMTCLTVNGSALGKQSHLKASDFQMKPMVTAIKLPASTDLKVEISNADFVLSHEDRNDVEVRVNYPRHWQVDDRGSIAQTAEAFCPTGVYITQNRNVLIGAGRKVPGAYSELTIGGDGVYVDGRKLPMEKKVTRAGVSGTEIGALGYFVNGRRVLPGSGIEGSDSELDCLQIAVPKDYQSSFTLTWKSELNGRMDKWPTGFLTIDSSGPGKLTIKEIGAKFALTATGNGAITINRLENQSAGCHLKLSNSARLKINDIDAAISLEAADKSQVIIEKGAISKITAILDGKANLSVGDATRPLGMKIENMSVHVKDQSHLGAVECRIERLSYLSRFHGSARIYGLVIELDEPSGSSGSLSMPRYYAK